MIVTTFATFLANLGILIIYAVVYATAFLVAWELLDRLRLRLRPSANLYVIR